MDIETDYQGNKTGQDLFTDYKNHRLICIGILVVDRDPDNPDGLFPPDFKRMFQLVNEVPYMKPPTPENLMEALDGVKIIYTYNGRSYIGGKYRSVGFDLPVIQAQLGMKDDWLDKFDQKDMMLDGHELGYYGGLKKVADSLNLVRVLPSKDGTWCQKMWKKYLETKQEAFLDLVLAYNKEDCTTLYEITKLLEIQRRNENVK